MTSHLLRRSALAAALAAFGIAAQAADIKLGAAEALSGPAGQYGQSIKNGFDLALTRAVSDAVSIPVIASGGVGNLQHLADGVSEGRADAVLAASIFHFGEYTVRQAKEYMAARGIEVRTPKSLKKAPEQEAFAALNLDLAIVVAYGLILPKAILDAPKRGALNLHGSLLPRWRGAAPIQRAIMAGDKVTGVQVMRMEEGLDTGAVLATAETPIEFSHPQTSVPSRSIARM